jgi:hypothetical protein
MGGFPPHGNRGFNCRQAVVLIVADQPLFVHKKRSFLGVFSSYFALVPVGRSVQSRFFSTREPLSSKCTTGA